MNQVNNFKPEDKNYWMQRPIGDERKDWRTSGGNWVDDYWGSIHHPHRQFVIDVLGWTGSFDSVLELGSNCGPNLALIRQKFPFIKDDKLGGVDLNPDAIMKAERELPGVKFWLASATELPFIADKSYDVVLADAVLMYLDPEEIKLAMAEINRIAKKTVVIIDWFDRWSLKGRIKDYHWCRNYARLLKKMGFAKVKKYKITQKEWQSPNWIKHGYAFTAVRQ